jgi:hypothetical protein
MSRSRYLLHDLRIDMVSDGVILLKANPITAFFRSLFSFSPLFGWNMLCSNVAKCPNNSLRSQSCSLFLSPLSYFQFPIKPLLLFLHLSPCIYYVSHSNSDSLLHSSTGALESLTFLSFSFIVPILDAFGSHASFVPWNLDLDI